MTIFMFRRRRLEYLKEVAELKEPKVSWKAYSLGNGPPIGMDVFFKNRKRLLDKIKIISRLAIIFVEGKTLDEKERYNMVEPFIQDSTFYWLFGIMEPNFSGAIDVLEETTYLFYPEEVAEEFSDMKSAQKSFLVDFVVGKKNLVGTLTDLKRKIVLLVRKHDVNNVISSLSETFEVDCTNLTPNISGLRVLKSASEVGAIEHASKVAANGIKFALSCATIGMSEHKLEALFSDYVLRMGGCRVASNWTFCSSSLNIDKLFNTSTSDRTIEEGVLVLLDVTVHYLGYHSTLSITFPISGTFTDDQERLYRIVITVRQAVLEKLKLGVSLSTLNEEAIKILLWNLRYDLYILHGSVEELLEAGIAAFFIPQRPCKLVGLGSDETGDRVSLIRSTSIAEDEAEDPADVGVTLSIELGYFFNKRLIEWCLCASVTKDYVKPKAMDFVIIGSLLVKDMVILTMNGWKLLADLPRKLNDIEMFLQESQKARAPYECYINSSD